MVERLRGWIEGLALGTATLLRESPDSPAELRAWLGAEGWLELPPALVVELDALSRCTACEACDAVCPLLGAANRAHFGGPMDLALRWGRLAPDLRLARAYLDTFARCGACHQCERACPQQIPLRALADALRQVLDDNGVPPARAAAAKTEGTQDPG